MTYHILTAALTAVLSASQPSCSENFGKPSEQRAFTNADLERIAACRRVAVGSSESLETKVVDGPGGPTREKRASTQRRLPEPSERQLELIEADWRAQWRSIDQKTRRLRREAAELRQEASIQPPSDPRKKVVSGRRTISALINKAVALETEAREMEDEFQTRARRAGALPGWLRAR